MPLFKIHMPAVYRHIYEVEAETQEEAWKKFESGTIPQLRRAIFVDEYTLPQALEAYEEEELIEKIGAEPHGTNDNQD